MTHNGDEMKTLIKREHRWSKLDENRERQVFKFTEGQ